MSIVRSNIETNVTYAMVNQTIKIEMNDRHSQSQTHEMNEFFLKTVNKCI